MATIGELLFEIDVDELEELRAQDMDITDAMKIANHLDNAEEVLDRAQSQ